MQLALFALLALGAVSGTSADSATTNTTRLDCTKTMTVYKLPAFAGPTLTVWTGTATTTTETTTLTSTADCSGCAHAVAVTKVRPGGHGPVLHYTTTVTLQAVAATETATQVAYVCE